MAKAASPLRHLKTPHFYWLVTLVTLVAKKYLLSLVGR